MSLSINMGENDIFLMLTHGLKVLGATYFYVFFGITSLMMAISFALVMRAYRTARTTSLLKADPRQYPPISILIPTYNESAVIMTTLINLLNLDYPEFEIIVSNDGSSDDTFKILQKNFDLWPAYNIGLNCLSHKPIRNIYRSRANPRLIVLNKMNGRKSDALNAALNIAKFDIYCCVDADGFIRRDGLKRCVQAFLDDPEVIGIGCGLRVMEGASLTGHTIQGGISNNLLAAFQSLEYLRAFLLERIAWVPLNAVPLISGAFALYKKDIIISLGGYRSSCIGDDADITMRVHRYMALIKHQPYKIIYLPEPVCWTQVPTDWKSLFDQRIRWQRGALDGVFFSPSLLFTSRQKALGWVTLPVLLFMSLGVPVFDCFCLIAVFTGLLTGLLHLKSVIIALSLVYSFWILFSVLAILLDQVTFKTYQNQWDVLKLFGLALIQPILYSPGVSAARLVGIYQMLKKSKIIHGTMHRHTPVFESVR